MAQQQQPPSYQDFALSKGFNGQKPSIIGVSNFDAISDAKEFRNAMNKKDSDEKTIIRLLTTRTNKQLQQIRKAYGSIYDGKDLMKHIKDELSGKLETVALSLLDYRPEYEAKILHNAMKGMGTDEELLTEIICTRNAEELKEIIKGYDRIYDKSLDKIVKSEVSGDYEKLLLACLECKREKEGKVNNDNAKKDAEALYKAGEKKFGTDEKKFIEILTLRSFSHISAISHEYEKISKNTLITAIKSEMSGNLEKGLVTIVSYARDPSAFWAEKLKDAMKGMGTDDEKLMRTMITRAEIDLRSTRDVFGDRYGKGKTLLDWIKSDTSGKYEDILVALLLGNEQK